MINLSCELKMHWAALAPDTRLYFMELLTSFATGRIPEEILLTAFTRKLVVLPFAEQGSAWQFMYLWLADGELALERGNSMQRSVAS